MKREWHGLFEPWILERGMEYYDNGLVFDLRRHGGRVFATVRGSEDYRVELLLDGDHVCDMDCDCPYAHEGENCKHMAAVLFAMEDDGSTCVESTVPTNWSDALDRLNADAMRRLIRSIAIRDEKIQERILQLADGTGDDCESWYADLERMVEKASDWDAYVDYDEAFDLMMDFIDYLEDRLEPLLLSGNTMAAVELTELVYRTAMELDMDDSDGGLTCLMGVCHSAWESALELADASMCAAIYRKLRALAENSNWGCGSDDLATFILSVDWGDELQKENLKWLDAQIESDGETEYHTFGLIENRARLMKNLGATDVEVMDFWKKYQHLSSVRDYLIRLYEDTAPQTAIKILLENRTQQTARWKAAQYTQKLVQMYQKTGQQELYETELQNLIFEYQCLEIPFVAQLKAITSESEWPSTFERLLSMSENRPTQLELLCSEKMYDRLLSEITQTGFLSFFLRYEAQLREWSREKTLQAYVQMLNLQMNCNSDRKMYRETIGHLKKLRAYPCGEENAKELARQWRLQYKRRPALQDELKKAGF